MNLSSVNEAVALVKTPSNGYIIGGSTSDGLLLVLKLDSNANIIYKREFGGKNYDKMNNLILLKDGGVLAIATSASSRDRHDNIFKSGLGLNDIYLTRFSSNGTELWSRKYGTTDDDKGIGAVEANDGSLIILGLTSHEQNRDITLMRLTQNGDKIWLKQYKSDTIVTPYKIIKLRDNNFLVSLSQQNELHKEQIRLMKFDLQNNILIDKYIDTTYASGLKDIKEFSDGTLIGVGYVKDMYNTDALVMILNYKLSLLGQEHYGEENFDIFNAVTILHNSQVAVAGINTSNSSQESNMWIVKLNRDGTMSQKSTKSVNFYNDLVALFKKEIEAGKIVIKENLTIELVDNELFFKVGQYKLTKNQENFLNKFSKKLIPFLNTNKNFVNSLEINGHTSSEWNGVSFSDKYLNNEQLSMNRAFSTLSHIFNSQTHNTQIWLTKVLRGSGFSYSKKIILNKHENREKSRRVSFKVILEEK
jgi:outer membrane protein OmpA-like peptidoglycan-associated protein